MRVTIDGQECWVQVQHDSAFGHTEAVVQWPEGQEALGWAQCSGHDQFCKRTGRRIAAKRLNAALKARGVSQEDRMRVLAMVVPECARFLPQTEHVEA